MGVQRLSGAEACACMCDVPAVSVGNRAKRNVCGSGRYLRKIGNAIIGAIMLQIYFDWSSVLQFAYFNKGLSAIKLIRI